MPDAERKSLKGKNGANSTMTIIQDRYGDPIFQSNDFSLRATVIRAVHAKHALRGAVLNAADLKNAFLRRASLGGAVLRIADLSGADMRDAILCSASLEFADLRNADLSGANLHNARLADARLSGTIMPDGRVWENYVLDPLAEICDEPDVRARAIAAWGEHAWGRCPMSAAHGWRDFKNVPAKLRIAVAAFVALFDSKLLPQPQK
jgi:Pentapeptide repeats (8 copies)